MKRLPSYIHSSQGKLWLTEDERDHLKISYQVKSIMFEETSPFQHVMVLDTYDFGPMLVLDGAVQTTSMDGHIYNEMISHVPLSIHPNPRKVLIIGGGDCGVAKEATKYSSVEQIDLVEIDEAVVRVSKKHLPEVSGNLSDPRVHYHYTDGVEFVKKVQNEYDVIIVDSSDPVGPAEQLFSLSFYKNLKAALNDNGIMVCQSQSPIFHSNVMSQTFSRIGQLFSHTRLYTAVVPTYPGGMWSFTLGSKKSLPNMNEVRFDKSTLYVNTDILRQCFALPTFVKELLTQERAVS